MTSNTSLIMGESGSGKSTSIRNLNPKETFIINVLNKPLPFRGYRAHYKSICAWDDILGNYYANDDYQKIMRCIKMVNENRPDIKNLIVDDWQYVLANEYMRRANEKGFQKFTDIGYHAWDIIKSLTECREDLYSFVISHSDVNEEGKVKCKTIGKLLDEKITIEGMFTLVLQTKIIDKNYYFLTQNDGCSIAKSPFGMFEDKYIPNDLSLVKASMDAYYFGDVVETKKEEAA